MITCVVNYTIDPGQLAAFERFALEWMRLVNKHGGQHHGYFLPGARKQVLRFSREIGMVTVAVE